jgi:hypothetical protein
MLKYCAANRKKQLSALPDVGPYIYIYIYMTLKFIYVHFYIYDINRLSVNLVLINNGAVIIYYI